MSNQKKVSVKSLERVIHDIELLKNVHKRSLTIHKDTTLEYSKSLGFIQALEITSMVLSDLIHDEEEN